MSLTPWGPPLRGGTPQVGPTPTDLVTKILYDVMAQADGLLLIQDLLWSYFLHAYSPRTLRLRLLFVCIDFVSVLLIYAEGGKR